MAVPENARTHWVFYKIFALIIILVPQQSLKFLVVVSDTETLEHLLSSCHDDNWYQNTNKIVRHVGPRHENVV